MLRVTSVYVFINVIRYYLLEWFCLFFLSSPIKLLWSIAHFELKIHINILQYIYIKICPANIKKWSAAPLTFAWIARWPILLWTHKHTLYFWPLFLSYIFRAFCLYWDRTVESRQESIGKDGGAGQAKNHRDRNQTRIFGSALVLYARTLTTGLSLQTAGCISKF